MLSKLILIQIKSNQTKLSKKNHLNLNHQIRKELKQKPSFAYFRS